MTGIKSSKWLALFFIVCMGVFSGTSMRIGSSAGSNYSLAFDPEKYSEKTLTLEDKTIAYRAYEEIVYVSNPVDVQYQQMNFYVPQAYYEGKPVGRYTADTAPIFFPNMVGGYMSGRPGSPDNSGGFGGPGGPFGFGAPGSPGMPPEMGPGTRVNTIALALSRGLVVASPGARGRTLKGDEGLYKGKAPACIVDLKAAVRFLRHNDKIMPGNAEMIVSNGGSAGGALSSLLGATGNSADYEPYLREIGAASERDDIFAASCYCPITNLDNSDSAYEWLFNGINDYNTRGREGTLTPDQIRISGRLKALFPAYLNSLGLKKADGTVLTLDANGEGAFKQYVKSFLIASAQIALDGGGDLSDKGWITIESHKVTDIDWDSFVAYATRMKGVPAFDTLNMNSPENNLFGSTTVDNRHFTRFAAEEDSKNLMAEATVVKMMNPMPYIGTQGVVTAPHWRIRHGTLDRDTSLAVPVILATKLENNGYDVNFLLPWDRGHGGDYDPDELFAWIDQVCRK